MSENFLWSFIPGELKLPHLSYHYFIHGKKHPFEPLATQFSMANAAWLTDLAFLAYADKRFITEQLNEAGLTGAPCFIGFDQDIESTQCIIAHNNEIIVVFFRGTEFNPKRILNAVLDTSIDIQAALVEVPELDGCVHYGFYKEAEKISATLIKTLDKIRTTQSVWFAGHSMGGALTILTAKLYSARTQRNVSGVYTIGCPRVGNETFAAHYQLPLYFLINHKDPITRIPVEEKIMEQSSNSGNYVPMGKTIFFDQTGGITDTDNRPPITRSFLRIGITLELSLIIDMLDHAPLRYSQKIWRHLS